MPGAEHPGRRGLSTARAVLQVQRLLAERSEGVRAQDAADALGKSVSTAYHLLASLCEEGVASHHGSGLYRLKPEFRELVRSGAWPDPVADDLSAIVDELLARTHKRSYLALRESGHLRIVLERGRQGMPTLRGLAVDIRDNAHALALGKVALALSPREALQRYLERGLRAFTPNTIASPGALLAQLVEIRRAGIATESEEFSLGVCCIAAPLLDEHRRFVGAVGISMSPRAFAVEREELAATLREVVDAARPSVFEACAELHQVLDPRSDPDLASRMRPSKGGRPSRCATGPSG